MNDWRAFLFDHRAEIRLRLAEHLLLTGSSIAIACLIALPLGVLVYRRRATEGPVLGAAGLLQTVPSLALLALLMVALAGLPARVGRQLNKAPA